MGTPMRRRIPEHLPGLAVLAVSSFVSLWGLWKEGLGNLSFAAGVHSIGLPSWKNAMSEDPDISRRFHGTRA
jgi:hypothetical protein